MEKRITKTCTSGASKSLGGLNMDEIIAILKSRGVVTKPSMSRKDLIALLCKNPAAAAAAAPAPMPVPSIDDDVETRLKVFCSNPQKSYSQGGFNIGHLNALVAKRGLAVPRGATRDELAAILCSKAKSKPAPPLREPAAAAAAAENVILALQATYDPPGVFDVGGDRGLEMVFKSFPEFKYVFSYVSSISDIEHIISTITEDGRKIAHLVMMAHGTQTGIQLDRSEVITITNDTLGKFAKILKPALAVNAPIFIHGCSVAKGGYDMPNFASELARQLGGHEVFGANAPVRRGDLLITAVEPDSSAQTIKLDYEVDSDRADYQMYRFKFGKPKSQSAGGKSRRIFHFRV